MKKSETSRNTLNWANVYKGFYDTLRTMGLTHHEAFIEWLLWADEFYRRPHPSRGNARKGEA